MFSRNILPRNDVWNCLSSTRGIQLMKRIFNVADLHLVKNFNEIFINQIEDELSRRSDNQLRDKLKSFKDVLYEVEYQLHNHHQIRRVS